MQEIDTWAKLLQPYADEAGQTQSFDSAITKLKAFVSQRAAAVETFLAQQN